MSTLPINFSRGEVDYFRYNASLSQRPTINTLSGVKIINESQLELRNSSRVFATFTLDSLDTDVAIAKFIVVSEALNRKWAIIIDDNIVSILVFDLVSRKFLTRVVLVNKLTTVFHTLVVPTRNNFKFNVINGADVLLIFGLEKVIYLDADNIEKEFKVSLKIDGNTASTTSVPDCVDGTIFQNRLVLLTSLVIRGTNPSSGIYSTHSMSSVFDEDINQQVGSYDNFELSAGLARSAFQVFLHSDYDERYYSIASIEATIFMTTSRGLRIARSFDEFNEALNLGNYSQYRIETFEGNGIRAVLFSDIIVYSSKTHLRFKKLMSISLFGKDTSRQAVPLAKTFSREIDEEIIDCQVSRDGDHLLILLSSGRVQSLSSPIGLGEPNQEQAVQFFVPCTTWYKSNIVALDMLSNTYIYSDISRSYTILEEVNDLGKLNIACSEFINKVTMARDIQGYTLVINTGDITQVESLYMVLPSTNNLTKFVRLQEDNNIFITEAIVDDSDLSVEIEVTLNTNNLTSFISSSYIARDWIIITTYYLNNDMYTYISNEINNNIIIIDGVTSIEQSFIAIRGEALVELKAGIYNKVPKGMDYDIDIGTNTKVSEYLEFSLINQGASQMQVQEYADYDLYNGTASVSATKYSIQVSITAKTVKSHHNPTVDWMVLNF